MSTIESIQFFVGINLVIMGLSHFFRPEIWVEFFEFLYKKGNVGNIFNAILTLGTGSIILSFHFIWTWPMILVTLYGVALVFKALIYLIFPHIGLKSIGNVNSETRKFRLVGLPMVLFGLVLLWQIAHICLK